MTHHMGPTRGRAVERADRAPQEHYIETPGGCWEWTCSTDTGGYGRTRYGGHAISAHRAYFAHYVAPIPAGRVVMHLCDHPPCVNPEHLAMGMQSANLGDMTRKGRSAKGEQVANAKLTATQARDIYERRMAGEKLRTIAEDHGVHVVTVSKIARGLMWRHVTNAA